MTDDPWIAAVSLGLGVLGTVFFWHGCSLTL